jgi:predicted Zn-dependent protease
MGIKVWVLRLFVCCFVLLCGQLAYADAGYFEIFFDEDKPYDYKLWERTGRFEQKVYEVGFKLLNENKFPKRVRFLVDDSNGQQQVINASADYGNGTITIWKGLLSYIESDDELAAVLGHELGHINQYSNGVWAWRRIKMYYAPKFYEYDADIKGVDYMVKAGYNPVAMISVMNRAFPEASKYRKFELFMTKALLLGLFFPTYFPLDTHPVSSKRLDNVYNHIQTNYPQYLNGENTNPYFQNFLMNSEKNKDIKEIKEKYNIAPDGAQKL